MKPVLGAGVVGLTATEVAKASKEATGKTPETESILVIHSQQGYDSLTSLFNE